MFTRQDKVTDYQTSVVTQKQLVDVSYQHFQIWQAMTRPNRHSIGSSKTIFQTINAVTRGGVLFAFF